MLSLKDAIHVRSMVQEHHDPCYEQTSKEQKHYETVFALSHGGNNAEILSKLGFMGVHDHHLLHFETHRATLVAFTH